MTINAYTILVVLALLFGVASIVKPAWPLCGVAVIFLAVAALIK
jgi:hypothetical protein